MAGDDDTLPEAQRQGLVRATIRPDDSSRDLVTDSLRGSSARGRVLALRAAARHEWLDNEQWLAVLTDDTPDVRREAAGLLARATPDAVVLTQLVATLADADPLVVDAAAFALGEQRHAAAVESLIAIATSHDDARCRECAVASLGNIGDDRARTIIIEALNDKPAVRRRAVVALANFEGADIEAALASARDDRDWQVRAAVDQLDRGESED